MTSRTLPAWLAPWAIKAIHLQGRIMRPLTMGVRGVILNGRDEVFLVRHSYVPGWHFPGGAVEQGESALTAVRREVMEETGIQVSGEPVLHGLFHNANVSARDHVAVFVIRDFTLGEKRPSDWEIVESGFFPTATLPDETTGATRRRLTEILDGAAVAETW